MAWARHVQNCQHASGPVPKATMRWLAGPEPCREDPDECSARIRCPDLICRCCQFSCAMTMSCFLETFNLDFLFRLFGGRSSPKTSAQNCWRCCWNPRSASASRPHAEEAWYEPTIWRFLPAQGHQSQGLMQHDHFIPVLV